MTMQGWDGRDYKLWSALQCLPSYGMVAGKDNKLVALNEIIKVIERQAVERQAGKGKAHE